MSPSISGVSSVLVGPQVGRVSASLEASGFSPSRAVGSNVVSMDWISAR